MPLAETFPAPVLPRGAGRDCFDVGPVLGADVRQDVRDLARCVFRDVLEQSGVPDRVVGPIVDTALPPDADDPVVPERIRGRVRQLGLDLEGLKDFVQLLDRFDVSPGDLGFLISRSRR